MLGHDADWFMEGVHRWSSSKDTYYHDTSKTVARSSDRLDRVLFDLLRLEQVETLNAKRFGLDFRDYYLHLSLVHLLRAKSDVPQVFERILGHT